MFILTAAVVVVVVVVVVLIGLIYKAIQPPSPRICGSPNGPPVTSSRIKLRDGRYLAYRERGVPKAVAKYKIVIAHGGGDSKDFIMPVSLELLEELGICLISFDRAGYGESEPYPERSVKSEAFDIQDLADQLHLGLKFYVIGISMGSYAAWGCLKYIPQRLAGVALISPIVNFWWPSLPANISRDGFRTRALPYQRSLQIAHYAPSLLYWWMTQRWFPSLRTIQCSPAILSRQDQEILQKMLSNQTPAEDKALQQGEFESIYRDLIVGFSNWDFDPLELKNPFPRNEGAVHLWQGYEDKLFPVIVQRYVSKRLPWIKYHEFPDSGHFLVKADGMFDDILRALVPGVESNPISI